MHVNTLLSMYYMHIRYSNLILVILLGNLINGSFFTRDLFS